MPEAARRRRPASLLALALVLLAGAAWGQADSSGLRVSLVTIGPGDIYWSRFGHNAIWVEEPSTGFSVTYNYGLFDVSEEDFFLNFARGRMRYLLGAFRADADLDGFVRSGRRVTIQRLALTEAQAERLVGFLEWNRLPENRGYLYDYFRDNCSTRVRDALDDVLDGAIEKRFESVPGVRGTYRDYTNRLAGPDPWVYLGTDFALGPAVDQPLSRWDEFFIPMEFAAAITELRVPDGGGGEQPLVYEQFELPVAEPIVEPSERPVWWPWFLAAGLVPASLLLLSGRAGGALRRAWWFGSGLLGAGLLALWGLTDHEAAYANANALLFCPLGLLLAFAPSGGRLARLAGGALACSVLAGVVLALTPLGEQRILDWVLLAMPLQLAAIVGSSRRPARSM